MGRFLARMLVAFLASVAFSPVASAAEIPPTNECTALYKKVLADYPKRSSKKADRIAATALVDGGCVTDAEPLLKDVKTKPFSKQCKIASRAGREVQDTGANGAAVLKVVSHSSRGHHERTGWSVDPAVSQQETHRPLHDKKDVVFIMGMRAWPLRVGLQPPLRDRISPFGLGPIRLE